MRPLKRNFPTEKIRRFIEPGPIVLVSSAWREQRDIMTMGWHTMMEFSPALLGCIIADSNYSFTLIRKSKECVINIPAVAMAGTVVGIGNCSGRDVDKFEKFGLTAAKAAKVSAPLISECFASLECRIYDGRLIPKYNFFVFEVLRAHVARSPKYPKTLHYTGDGMFMKAGTMVNLRRGFLKKNL